MNYFQSNRKGDSGTRRLFSALSVVERDRIDENIYLRQILEEAYPDNYREIELLILSVADYTHREISEALNMSRIGVTKRITKAREILGEIINNDISKSDAL